MKVILISGHARNGKDQTAKFMSIWLNNHDKKVIILHYADFLKEFLKSQQIWDGVKDEKGRELLQYWGTDVCRNNYENIWTDMMIALLKGIESEFDYVLIPDVRFPNEITELQNKTNYRVIPVRVSRPGFDNGLTESQKQHRSETALDNFEFEFQIINNEGLAELCKDVSILLTEVLKIKE